MKQLDFEDLLAVDAYVSVGKLTRDIKTILESSFQKVWVQGEISNFIHHSSGHMYFSLKDANAQISCVMWRSNVSRLLFTPADGMKVLVKARLAVYEKRGNYQLDVWQLQPAGVGELQIAFEKLRRKLHEEGLFDEESKQPLPQYPQRIGIVSSPSGAAIRDLKSVLFRRAPSLQVLLFPVRVQGESAAAEIAGAIEAFNRYGKVEVIIVSRGGGSLEDLWAFNEEAVARAIFDSRIPVVSAVGHEVDFTISDFVADFRAPTPSAAAELVVRSREEIEAQLGYLRDAMSSAFNEKCSYLREKLRSLRESYGLRHPLDVVRQAGQRLDELSRHLRQSGAREIEVCRERLSGLQRRLALLEHASVLRRGYSICFRKADGALVTQADQLEPGEGIEVGFAVGHADATVDSIVSGNEER